MSIHCTNVEPNPIAERLELAAKIIREKAEFEVRRKSQSLGWESPDRGVVDYLCIFDWDVRIKLTPAPPKLVPLTAADIPPGSAYRYADWPQDQWTSILSADHAAVLVGHFLLYFTSAFERPKHLLKRPGETTWSPFSKTEEPTTTPS